MQEQAMQKCADTDLSLQARFSSIKTGLRKELGDTLFRSWIAPLEIVSASGGVLALSVPSRFVRDWVRSHYAERLRLLWSKNHFPVARVELTVGSGKRPAVVAEFSEDVVLPANQNATDGKGAENMSSPLDLRFTFDTFIVGASNQMAHAAAKLVADNAGKAQFNPLFIHGGVGLGKTHLMQAVGHKLAASAAAPRVVYMSAERFMYRFVKAIRGKDTMVFKESFRDIDVLLIDDVQFICGKEATQEEFFHICHAMIADGRQIILTADRSPTGLDGLEQKLKSRLAGGLAVEVAAPDADLRRKILAAKCTQMNRAVDAGVIDLIASADVASVRELEGALNRIIVQADMIGQSPSVEAARDLLRDILRTTERRVTVEDIQKQVAAFYKISLADLLSERRSRPLARPRQVAMYLAKQLTSLSLPDIGRKFSGRDHTTIIHGVRKVEELMAADADFRDGVVHLKNALART